jgi:hypothetical protein
MAQTHKKSDADIWPGGDRWRATELFKRDFTATQVNLKWFGAAAELFAWAYKAGILQ